MKKCLCIAVLALAALAASLTSCKNPAGEATGTITINLGVTTGNARALAWPPEDTNGNGIMKRLVHRVTLTGASEITRDIGKDVLSVNIPVTPGNYTVTVVAYLDDFDNDSELYAMGIASDVKIAAGETRPIRIVMGPLYRVTMTSSDLAHGTALASTEYALEDWDVILTATAEAGYRFDKWQLSSDNGLTYTDITTATTPEATYTMPAYDVTIRAVFVPGTPDLDLDITGVFTENAVYGSGYALAAVTFDFNNSGDATAAISAITLGGDDTAFTLIESNPSVTSVPAKTSMRGGTLQPKPNLDAGTYSPVIIVTYSGGAMTTPTQVTKTLEPFVVTPGAPKASDFIVSNLTQIEGSATNVSISPLPGKSGGNITVYYDGGALPMTAGEYAVTFNVAANSPNWAATTARLSAGTLVVLDANDVLNVTDTASWTSARNTISAAGNDNKSWLINVTGNVGIPASTGSGAAAYTFGSRTGITVTLVGTGKLYLTGRGSLLRINVNQTVILDSATLTLQGLTNNVDGATTDNDSPVIELTSAGATFTMNNGTISGNKSEDSYSGSGVYLYNTTFTMNGGAITGNESGAYGGGVALENSTFTMNGGSISGNLATAGYSGFSGGGVYVDGDSIFSMSGGEISDNIAGYSGGGVAVEGTFNMSGGTISGNEASNGGGVHVDGINAVFNMRSGVISANRSTGTMNSVNGGGGVYASGNSSYGSVFIETGTIYGMDETVTSLRNTAVATNNSAAFFRRGPSASNLGITEYGVFSGDTWRPLGSLTTTNDTIMVINGELQ